ncbi:hypothetical protein ABIB74_007263 [Bradyrhizobium sp. F1.6.2]
MSRETAARAEHRPYNRGSFSALPPERGKLLRDHLRYRFDLGVGQDRLDLAWRFPVLAAERDQKALDLIRSRQFFQRTCAVLDRQWSDVVCKIRRDRIVNLGQTFGTVIIDVDADDEWFKRFPERIPARTLQNIRPRRDQEFASRPGMIEQLGEFAAPAICSGYETIASPGIAQMIQHRIRMRELAAYIARAVLLADDVERRRAATQFKLEDVGRERLARPRRPRDDDGMGFFELLLDRVEGSRPDVMVHVAVRRQRAAIPHELGEQVGLAPASVVRALDPFTDGLPQITQAVAVFGLRDVTVVRQEGSQPGGEQLLGNARQEQDTPRQRGLCRGIVTFARVRWNSSTL